MISRFQTSLRIALALTATVLAHAAYATGRRPAATAAPDAAAALTPPKLVTFVDATYPAAAKAARLQADVDLELTIDATGAVTEARVVTPVGNGFDEAALEAARRFVFEPAKRGDKAIPARIKYRYVFELAAEAAPLPTTGELEGKVLVAGRQPDRRRRARHAERDGRPASAHGDHRRVGRVPFLRAPARDGFTSSSPRPGWRRSQPTKTSPPASSRR